MTPLKVFPRAYMSQAILDVNVTRIRVIIIQVIIGVIGIEYMPT
jgi:hypothetical protein